MFAAKFFDRRQDLYFFPEELHYGKENSFLRLFRDTLLYFSKVLLRILDTLILCQGITVFDVVFYRTRILRVINDR